MTTEQMKSAAPRALRFGARTAWSRLLAVAVPLVLFALVTGCASTRTVRQAPKPALAQGDLVAGILRTAGQKYQEGNLEAAYTLLQGAMEIDPDNPRTQNFLGLVQGAMHATTTDEQDADDEGEIQLWYPTMPPKPSE